MSKTKNYFVLIGGETCDSQGADLSKREYLHTSLSFVAKVIEKFTYYNILFIDYIYYD